MKVNSDLPEIVGLQMINPKSKQMPFKQLVSFKKTSAYWELFVKTMEKFRLERDDMKKTGQGGGDAPMVVILILCEEFVTCFRQHQLSCITGRHVWRVGVAEESLNNINMDDMEDFLQQGQLALQIVKKK
ncbi:hypothetical protein pdam_00024272, partial [Pocillopora damicornis]